MSVGAKDADGVIVFDATERPLLFVMKWGPGEWTSQIVREPAEPGTFHTSANLYSGKTRIEAIERGLSVIHRRK